MVHSGDSDLDYPAAAPACGAATGNALAVPVFRWIQHRRQVGRYCYAGAVISQAAISGASDNFITYWRLARRRLIARDTAGCDRWNRRTSSSPPLRSSSVMFSSGCWSMQRAYFAALLPGVKSLYPLLLECISLANLKGECLEKNNGSVELWSLSPARPVRCFGCVRV